MSMRVLHISTSDRGGGAAIAAYRLTEAMRKGGIEAKMLVCEKKSDASFVIPIPKSTGRFSRYLLPVIPVFFNFIRGKIMQNSRYSFINGVSSSYRITKDPIIKEADIIYIHWVQGSFLSISDIEKIIKTGKKIFFVLHDMWYLTGGCHHSFTCNRWLTDCRQCPAVGRTILKNYPTRTLKMKIRKWNAENVGVITPSEWLSEKARNSPIFAKRQIFTIPNTINSETFAVVDKTKARRMLGLPVDRKLLLFGAIAGSTNPYKGWNYMREIMDEVRNADLVVFGNSVKSETIFTIHGVGRITDETSLALLYNAVDLFVSPTLAESFGQTIIESLSCGTRVAVFGAGAVPEIMSSNKYGSVVKVGDSKALAGDINRLLSYKFSDQERFSLHEEIRSKYSYPIICSEHASIFSM